MSVMFAKVHIIRGTGHACRFPAKTQPPRRRGSVMVKKLGFLDLQTFNKVKLIFINCRYRITWWFLYSE